MGSRLGYLNFEEAEGGRHEGVEFLGAEKNESRMCGGLGGQSSIYSRGKKKLAIVNARGTRQRGYGHDCSRGGGGGRDIYLPWATEAILPLRTRPMLFCIYFFLPFGIFGM